MPRSALSVPNFRTYFISAAIAQCGGWLLRTTQAWLVLELTGSVPTVDHLDHPGYLDRLEMLRAGRFPLTMTIGLVRDIVFLLFSLAISSVPTVLAFQDGREVSRLVGLRPESAYQKLLGAAGVS